MAQTIPVLGIAGRARSGKDTVRNFIIAARGGYGYSFADPIRSMLKGIGVDMTDPYWVERKDEIIPLLGVSPRKLMQTLGTEWGRQLIKQDIWLLMARAALLKRGPGMIIADVRFENEAQWVRDQGGRILHVLRPKTKDVEAHASERPIAVLEVDLQIRNEGSLEDLQHVVRALLSEHQT